MLLSSSLYIVDERYWRDPYLFFCLLLCITSKKGSHDTVSFSSFPTPLKRIIRNMAPEQIEGHPKTASDQYSLGVVVYEWLCGERPFEGSVPEVMVKHLSMPPPPLRERVPLLPAEVEQVVLQSLAKDPKLRFASVQDFALALEEACRTEVSSGHTLLALSSVSPHNRHTSTLNLPAALTRARSSEADIYRKVR